MHTFSVLISPSGPLAGSKVVIIGNSGHAVASGYRKHAATSEKALIHATFQSVVMILINFKSKSGSQLLNESKELFFFSTLMVYPKSVGVEISPKLSSRKDTTAGMKPGINKSC